MKVFSFFTLLSLLASSLYSQSYGYKKATHEQEGKVLPYRILLPEGYTMDKKYPLLLFLHGSGERGNDNKLQLVHGSELFLAEDFRKKHPAIVVFPQCPKDEYWATVIDRQGPLKFDFPKKPKNNPTLDLLEGMLESILLNYGVDKKRVYIGGLSMGGMGTFEMVYRNPKRFAAAFAICGGANPKIARKIRRPAWRIDHGEVDDVVPVQLSILMADVLKEQKANVQLRLYPEANHNSWENVFADPTFLPWLFSQSN